MSTLVRKFSKKHSIIELLYKNFNLLNPNNRIFKTYHNFLAKFSTFSKTAVTIKVIEKNTKFFDIHRILNSFETNAKSDKVFIFVEKHQRVCVYG